jgi:hypothetical protein
MLLPVQNRPVSRGPDRSLSRGATDPQVQSPQSWSDGQSQGVSPADYQDCYRLRGAAQKLCLNYY